MSGLESAIIAEGEVETTTGEGLVTYGRNMRGGGKKKQVKNGMEKVKEAIERHE